MTVIGHPLTFHQKNLFTIEIDGLGRAAFARCSELSFEVAKIEYWAGGSLIPHKAPGRLTYPDVTLERGVTGDLGLFNWFNEVANVTTGVGFANPGFKHGVELIQHERDETILRRWHLVNAWPVKFVAGEWSGDADEILMEQVVLTFDYPELLQ
jgi:phage tail-like protein